MFEDNLAERVLKRFNGDEIPPCTSRDAVDVRIYELDYKLTRAEYPGIAEHHLRQVKEIYRDVETKLRYWKTMKTEPRGHQLRPWLKKGYFMQYFDGRIIPALIALTRIDSLDSKEFYEKYVAWRQAATKLATEVRNLPKVKTQSLRQRNEADLVLIKEAERLLHQLARILSEHTQVELLDVVVPV